MKDYEQQKAAGLDPSFDPVRLGIRNADFWEGDQMCEPEQIEEPLEPEVEEQPEVV